MYLVVHGFRQVETAVDGSGHLALDNYLRSICFLRVRIACNRYRAAIPTPTK